MTAVTSGDTVVKVLPLRGLRDFFPRVWAMLSTRNDILCMWTHGMPGLLGEIFPLGAETLCTALCLTNKLFVVVVVVRSGALCPLALLYAGILSSVKLEVLCVLSQSQ